MQLPPFLCSIILCSCLRLHFNLLVWQLCSCEYMAILCFGLPEFPWCILSCSLNNLLIPFHCIIIVANAASIVFLPVMTDVIIGSSSIFLTCQIVLRDVLTPICIRMNGPHSCPAPNPFVQSTSNVVGTAILDLPYWRCCCWLLMMVLIMVLNTHSKHNPNPAGHPIGSNLPVLRTTGPIGWGSESFWLREHEDVTITESNTTEYSTLMAVDNNVLFKFYPQKEAWDTNTRSLSWNRSKCRTAQYHCRWAKDQRVDCRICWDIVIRRNIRRRAWT